jgi:hypothetical protein
MEKATRLYIRGGKNNLLPRNHKPLTSVEMDCKRFPVGAPGRLSPTGAKSPLGTKSPSRGKPGLKSKDSNVSESSSRSTGN